MALYARIILTLLVLVTGQAAFADEPWTAREGAARETEVDLPPTLPPSLRPTTSTTIDPSDFVSLVPSLEASAGRAAAGPAAGHRVVRRFDFNEQHLGNFETMPMHWYRVQGPGFPRFTSMGFDTDHAVAGGHSLKLQLNGGSAAVMLASGVVAAIPGAQYMVTGHVRTANARHSRARVWAVFLDQHNRPLEQTRTDSALLQSNDAWTPIQIALPETPGDAAWVSLRLELLQPEQFRRTTLGPHELSTQDIHAAAWFDDILIYQLPQIELTTQQPYNVVRAPQTPQFNATIRDLSGGTLDATLTVYDDAGNLLGRQDRTIRSGEGGSWQFSPELPAFGWYWAELEVHDQGMLIGHALTAVSYLPPRRRQTTPEDARSMLVLDDVPAGHRHLIVDLLEALGRPAIRMNLWREQMTAEDLAEATGQADPLVMELIRQNMPLTLAIGDIPRHLAEPLGTDPDRPLDLFAADDDAWLAPLTAALALYGHQVERWHLGRPGHDAPFHRDDLAEVYAAARDVFGRYVPRPRLSLMWQGTHQLAGVAPEGLDGLLINIPTSVRPDTFGEYFAAWGEHPGEQIVHLQPLGLGRHSHRERAADLAMRMIRAHVHEPQRLAIPHPWAYHEGTPPSILPDPLLGVWAHVGEQLAGRRLVGELELKRGVRGLLLQGDSAEDGVLVTWNESADTAEAALAVRLGDEPVAVDIYGNREPLRNVEGRQVLDVGESVQFIEGIDMRLALLRAGFQLDEPFVESIHAAHERTLTVANPWERTISGRLRVTGPERWDIQPRLVNFSIPAGETFEVPLTLTFPISQIAGDTQITADVRIEADRTYDLQLAAPVTVGLEDVEYHATTSVDGEDLIVTAMVSNVGDEAMTYFAFALSPEHPRNERIISDLQPGQTMVRRFRFAGGAASLSGRQIRAGLRQSNGPAMLNHRVDVP